MFMCVQVSATGGAEDGRKKTAASGNPAQPQLLPALRVAVDPKAQARMEN